MRLEPLGDTTLRELSKLLADNCTGTEMTEILERENIPDVIGQGQTKWRRIYPTLKSVQTKYQCSNHTFAMIKAIFDPIKHANNPNLFEEQRKKLNVILAFSGFEYGSNGNIQRCHVARTITEAQRHDTIQAKLRGRNIHPKVLTYCKPELLQNNYFHAVFEATKGLAQHIREKSGCTKDGTALVDEVFSRKDPVLAFNALETETEKSEQSGFAALLKGCFTAIRNPHAHTPKIHWEGEDNAADYLTLVSLLHRKIDDCRRVSTS